MSGHTASVSGERSSNNTAAERLREHSPKCLSIFIDVFSGVFQSCHCCVLFFLRQMIIKENPCLDPPGLI